MAAQIKLESSAERLGPGQLLIQVQSRCGSIARAAASKSPNLVRIVWVAL